MDEVTEPLLMLLVAMVMHTPTLGQMETLGSEDGMPLCARGDRKRLYQVADARVQRNQSPGETRHC